MNFSDVIKKSVMEGFSYADLSTTKIMTTLLITFAIAVYIFFVYKLVTKSAFYFRSFNVSMAIISVVTAGIILAMQSSIVISLGMVGALSIVRFRTAIKDPMDLMFLFWSISVGIICGAGLAQVAVVLSIILTIGVLILEHFPVAKAPMILVVNACNIDSEQNITDAVSEYLDSLLGERNKAIIMLLYISGLRVSELCNLTFNNINFEEVYKLTLEGLEMFASEDNYGLIVFDPFDIYSLDLDIGDLKEFAKKKNIAILLTTNLARPPLDEDRAHPVLSDMKFIDKKAYKKLIAFSELILFLTQEPSTIDINAIVGKDAHGKIGYEIKFNKN